MPLTEEEENSVYGKIGSFAGSVAPAVALTGLGADTDKKLITFEAPSLSIAGLHSGNQAF